MSSTRRTTLIFGGFITAVAVAFYPIFFHPLSNKEDYISVFEAEFEADLFTEQVQKINRAGVNQADVQPVGVKIWSDPYKPKS